MRKVLLIWVGVEMSYFYNYEWILIKKNLSFYMLNRMKRQEYEINSELFELLFDIQKSNTMDNSLFEIDESLFRQLVSMNVFLKTETDKCEVVKIVPAERRLKRIFIELTNKCNERCIHCYVSASSFNHQVLDINLIKKIIDDAAKVGAYHFQITGGEPFLHPDIEEILDYSWSKGFIININTNLTILKPNVLDKIVKYGIKINFSLDFSNSDAHDSFRGLNGAFERTITNYKKIVEKHVPTRVNVMLNNKTNSEIENLINLIKFDLKSDFVADYALPVGRGKDLKQIISIEDSAEKYAYINSLRSKSNCASCDLSSPDFKNIKNRSIVFQDCGIGKDFIYINSAGRYMLCPSLYTQENKQMYCTSVSVVEAWDSLLSQYQIQIKCKYSQECVNFSSCNGGCRSRAYSTMGHLDSVDPLMCGSYKINYLEKELEK